MYRLRSRFAWSAFDTLFEIKSRIAFCEVPDRLGFGITIILAWRQMKQSFYPKAFYPLTESCSLGYVTIKRYKNTLQL